jgi:hypothetical protein
MSTNDEVLTVDDRTLLLKALREYRGALNDERCGDDRDAWIDDELVLIEVLRRKLQGAYVN